MFEIIVERVSIEESKYTERCFPSSSTTFTSSVCTPLEYKCGFHLTTNNSSLTFVQFFHPSLLIRIEQLLIGAVENASIRICVESANNRNVDVRICINFTFDDSFY